MNFLFPPLFSSGTPVMQWWVDCFLTGILYLTGFPYSISVFFFLPPTPNWILSIDLSSTSQIISLGWSSLMMMLFGAFFVLFIVFLSSRICVWFFFMTSVSLLNFSFCSLLFSWFCWTIFLCFLVVYWASLKQLFWILYFCGVGYWKITVFLWWHHVFLVFHVLWRLALLSWHYKSSYLLQSLLTGFRNLLC